MLQVLIARDPSAVRPRIRAWLPAGFRPPQLRIGSEQQAPQIFMVRPLAGVASAATTLRAEDVFYWRSDAF